MQASILPAEAFASIDQMARFFPQLEIMEPLGRGLLGPVFKARPAESDQLLALHVIAMESADGPCSSDLLAREAERLSNFQHPHFASVFGFGEVPETDGAGYFLIAEYVEGLSLRPVVESKKLAPREVLAIVCQICEALQAAHDERLVHGDFKAENVLIDKSGQIKIVNLGLKQLAGLRVTDAESASQKKSQVSDPADHRDDIFALGALLYELLTGAAPSGHDVRPSQRADVDCRLDEIAGRALAADPRDRYQQAIDLKQDLQRLAEPPPPVAAVNATAEADVEFGFQRAAGTAAEVIAEANTEPAIEAELAGEVIAAPPAATTAAATAPRPAAYFKDEPPQFPRRSRKAMLGALLIPCAFLAPAGFIYSKFAAAVEMNWRFAWQWEWLQVAGPLGLSIALLAMLCGLLAIRDIRRSAGMVTGLSLAFFDVILIPLLVIDAAVYGLCLFGAMTLENLPASVPPYLLALLVAVPVFLIIDLSIICWAWRRVTGRRPGRGRNGYPYGSGDEEGPVARSRRARFPLFTLVICVGAMVLTYAPWIEVDEQQGQFDGVLTYTGPVEVHGDWLVALATTRVKYSAWDSGLAFRQRGSSQWIAEIPNSTLFFAALVIAFQGMARGMGVGTHAALQIIPLLLAVAAGAQVWLVNCVSVQYLEELHVAPLSLLAAFGVIALVALGTMLLAVLRTLFRFIRRERAERDFTAAMARA